MLMDVATFPVSNITLATAANLYGLKGEDKFGVTIGGAKEYFASEVTSKNEDAT